MNLPKHTNKYDSNVNQQRKTLFSKYQDQKLCFSSIADRLRKDANKENPIFMI